MALRLAGHPMPPTADTVRERVLAHLKRHGRNATSFQVLEPGYDYWFDPADRGCVAYQDTGSAWVAAGVPIAAGADQAALAADFAATARSASRRASFFGAEHDFAEGPPVHAMVLGEQPVWNPQQWADTVAASRSLKEQLRRARAKGVVVRRIDAAEARGPLRSQLEALRDTWLERQSMPPMGFLVKPDLFGFASERRWYVAERDGGLCAALICVPVYARGGWLFEDLLRASGVPNGTSDLLVDAAMRDLAGSDVRYATLGLAPLAGPVNGWLRLARTLGSRLFGFGGLRAFKARLHPHRWEPFYLAWPRRQRGFVAVFDALRAFADGSLLRFGWKTVRRDPGMVLRLAPAMLAPAVLALLPTD